MDKQDLRKDPVRNKIIGIMALITGNIFVAIGLGAVALVLVLGISYYSMTKKESNMKSAISLGKSINKSISGNKEDSILELTEMLNENSSSQGVASAYLIDYYFSKDNIFMVDSILNLKINIPDNVLSSKVSNINGDICFDRLEFVDAIEHYSQAIESNPLLKDELDLKIALSKIELDDYSSAKILIEQIMKNDDLPYNIKNQCEKYLSLINHSM